MLDNGYSADEHGSMEALDVTEETHEQVIAAESRLESGYLAILSAHEYYAKLDAQASHAEGGAAEKGGEKSEGGISNGTGRLVALVTGAVTAGVALVRLKIASMSESAQTERERLRQEAMTRRETLRQEAMTRRAEITGRSEESPGEDESGGTDENRASPQAPDAGGS
ncbi:hypothetical protein [Streptomyces sp. NPDC056948]|uniref:hypothetical protein n=1 Tax=Streptomyces sp. NPDC056948 TaxID=3345975 RepID=UPI003639E3CB